VVSWVVGDALSSACVDAFPRESIYPHGRVNTPRHGEIIWKGFGANCQPTQPLETADR